MIDIIKIAIVDDHQIVIDGLNLLLGSEKNISIKFQTTDGFELIKYLENNAIDIVLTDIMMPSINGFELAMIIKKDFPNIKIIALSMIGESEMVHKMIHDAEIDGYLLKTSDKKQLTSAIEKVAKGGQAFSDDILVELDNFSKIKKIQADIHLTAREVELIKYLANGYTNKKIAQELFISERTVETHRKNILRKTDTHSVLSLIEYARKIKII